MRLHLMCPHCNQEMAVRWRHAGANVACPTCAGIVTLPRTGDRCPLSARAPRLIDCRIVIAAGVAAVLLVAGMVTGSATLLKRQRVAAVRPQRTDVLVRVAAADAIEPSVSVSAPQVPSAAVSAPQVPSPPPPPMIAEPAVPRVVSQRLPHYDDEDLRKQLVNVPELRLDSASAHSIEIRMNAAKTANRREAHFTLSVLDSQADLAGLPLRRGSDCQLGKEPAEYLQLFSRTVRRAMNDKQVVDMSPDVIAATVSENLRSYTGSGFPETVIPTMMQMLCVEKQSMRLMVIKQLAATQHRRASAALVKMALFDISEKIRAEAIAALRQRPAEEYRDALLAGFRYPWAPVADHAAEALVGLEDRAAVAALKKLAEQPDPAAAFYDPDKHAHVVREVVRINHLRNCLMCHAPSTSTTDLVRGRVPTPGEALPPAIEYYEGQNGIFVRADITYLRQDFSLFQPVDNADPWPNLQRYDYVVRTRPATATELNARDQGKAPPSPQRLAVRYALKALEELSKNAPPLEIAKE